jgi:alanyl-tRNA synthetase
VLKIRSEELPERVEALVKEIRDLKKRLAAGPRIESGTPEQLLTQADEVHGTKVLVLEVPDSGTQGLRDLIDQLRRKASPIAVMLASRTEDGKVSLVAGLSRDLTEKKLDAVQWIRSAAGFIGGGGGGRPDLAQAGGKEAGKLAEALTAAKEKIRELLGG